MQKDKNEAIRLQQCVRSDFLYCIIFIIEFNIHKDEKNISYFIINILVFIVLNFQLNAPDSINNNNLLTSIAIYSLCYVAIYYTKIVYAL